MTKDNEEIKQFQARLQACLIECINNQNISKAEICRRANISPQLLNTYIKRDLKTYPAGDVIADLARTLNVSLDWLISGKGLNTAAKVDNSLFCCIKNSQMRILEDGTVQWHELTDLPDTYYSLSFFDSEGINQNLCRRFKVQCDTMSPLIRKGDYVLIELSDVTLKNIINNAVYALVFNNELVIYRLIKQFNRVIIRSDNPSYPDIVFSDEDMSKVRILGRIYERSGRI